MSNRGWLANTIAGQNFLNNQSGHDLTTSDGQKWLSGAYGWNWLAFSQAGQNWAGMSYDSETWLNSNDGQKWLDSGYGKFWSTIGF